MHVHSMGVRETLCFFNGKRLVFDVQFWKKTPTVLYYNTYMLLNDFLLIKR
jgi:hypothetical protein